MIIEAIFGKGKPVQRIWLGGRIVWPLDIGTDISHCEDIFTIGIYDLLAADATILVIESPSETHSGSGVLIAPAILCKVRMGSHSRSYSEIVICDAVLLKKWEDIASPYKSDMLPADGVLLKRWEDIATPYVAPLLVAEAKLGKRWEDFATSYIAHLLHAASVDLPGKSESASIGEIAASITDALSVATSMQQRLTDSVVLLCGDGVLLTAELLSQSAGGATAQISDAIYLLTPPKDVGTTHTFEVGVPESAHMSSGSDWASTHEATAGVADAEPIVATTWRHSIIDWPAAIHCGEGLSLSDESLILYGGNAKAQIGYAIHITAPPEHTGITHNVKAIVADSVHVSAEEGETQIAGYAGLQEAEAMPVAGTAENESDDEAGADIASREFVAAELKSTVAEGCEAAAEVAASASIGSLLHFVARCEAHVSVASAVAAVSESAIETTTEAVIDFDVNEPDEPVVWYDPVKNGNNVYIRSVYSATKDGKNVTIK